MHLRLSLDRILFNHFQNQSGLKNYGEFPISFLLPPLWGHVAPEMDQNKSPQQCEQALLWWAKSFSTSEYFSVVCALVVLWSVTDWGPLPFNWLRTSGKRQAGTSRCAAAHRWAQGFTQPSGSQSMHTGVAKIQIILKLFPLLPQRKNVN